MGKILDQKTGELIHAGYGLGLEDQVVVNFEDARPVSEDPNSLMNKLRYRSWNYFLMNTPTHMIQFNFVDVVSDAQHERGLCPSSLIILDKRDPAGTF